MLFWYFQCLFAAAWTLISSEATLNFLKVDIKVFNLVQTVRGSLGSEGRCAVLVVIVCALTTLPTYLFVWLITANTLSNLHHPS